MVGMIVKWIGPDALQKGVIKKEQQKILMQLLPFLGPGKISRVAARNDKTADFSTFYETVKYTLAILVKRE